MSGGSLVKAQRRTLVDRFAKPDNLKGFWQVANTLIPYAALWYAVALSAQLSHWLTAGVTLLMALFLTRIFVLMHECGHGSLFRSGGLNRGCGFLLGVLAGMPQYVWSQHHAFHHATNGNWAKYRGPLVVITCDEYATLSEGAKRSYRRARHIAISPFAGFLYVIFNPRWTWLKGSASFLLHVVRGKIARRDKPFRALAAEFKTPYWTSSRQYWHMLWNNVVLLSLWLAMSWAIGPALFFPVYLVSVSLSGAVGIVLFAVQHNFKYSYASGDEGWDLDAAAFHGTSFLILPPWLNWFTANIAYHHVHHLSAGIPNYRLADCHAEYQHLFSEVPRLRFSEIPGALKHILWDTRADRIVSIAEFEAGR